MDTVITLMEEVKQYVTYARVDAFFIAECINSCRTELPKRNFSYCEGYIDHRRTCDNAEAKKMLFPAQSMATLADNDTLLKWTSTELPEDFPLKFNDAIKYMPFLRITCCLTEHGTYANGRG